MDSIRLSHSGQWPDNVVASIPLSKSISNRVLILNALSHGKIYSEKYSDSNDTLILKRLLGDNSSEIFNAEDAGTAYRFFLAYAAFSELRIELRGSKRMEQRPIKPLVDALEQLGAKISYVKKDGYPPIRIKQGINQDKSKVIIEDTKSSQFISALMLISPFLNSGIEITFPKYLPSCSYLEMSNKILKTCGIGGELKNGFFSNRSKKPKETNFNIEGDWSSASFLLALFKLGNWNSLILPNLFEESVQGDSKALDFLGYENQQISFKSGYLRINSYDIFKNLPDEIDLSNHPDLALPFLIYAACERQNLIIRGIENLSFKESNRIESMQTELSKIGCRFQKESDYWHLDASQFTIPDNLYIKTYKDHRIAMSFALLALFSDVQIEGPSVVNKSYPEFWNDLKKLGFRIA